MVITSGSERVKTRTGAGSWEFFSLLVVTDFSSVAFSLGCYNTGFIIDWLKLKSARVVAFAFQSPLPSQKRKPAIRRYFFGGARKYSNARVAVGKGEKKECLSSLMPEAHNTVAPILPPPPHPHHSPQVPRLWAPYPGGGEGTPIKL